MQHMKLCDQYKKNRESLTFDLGRMLVTLVHSLENESKPSMLVKNP